MVVIILWYKFDVGEVRESSVTNFDVGKVRERFGNTN